MKERVRVVVRVRPFLNTDGDHTPSLVVNNKSTVHIKNRAFSVDHVYSPDATTDQIFESEIEPLVSGFLEGFNTTVLAYGQTGSGKTFTISGILPALMDSVIARHGEDVHHFQFQYVEIYGDTTRDLLDPDPSSTAGKVQIVEEYLDESRSTVKRVAVSGATVLRVNRVRDALRLLHQGTQRRATAATNMNEDSSRSHSILSIEHVRSRAKFHLVDLAGSERNKKTLNTGVRFKESIAINTGLLTLGNVIRALHRNALSEQPNGYVPYRNSKLTRLLQDSLGGNCRTLFVACVAPNQRNADETLRSLQYCALAQRIVNEATVQRPSAPTDVAGDYIDHAVYEEICTYCLAQEEELTVTRAEMERTVGRLSVCEEELRNDTIVFQRQIGEIERLAAYSVSLEERVRLLEDRLGGERQCFSSPLSEEEGTQSREEQLFRLAKEVLHYQNHNTELKNKLSAAVSLLDSQRRESALLRLEINELHQALHRDDKQ